MWGFLPLFEIRIYDHFWMCGVQNLEFIVGVGPTLNRWLSQPHVGEKDGALRVGIKEYLGQLGHDYVIWHCLPDAYPLKMVTWYSGCIICFDTVKAYHPERIVTQICRVQGISRPPIPTLATKRAKHVKGYKVQFPMLRRYVDDWESHILSNS